MDSNTLYVPINIQAMVVNDQSRKAENFQRWQMNYKNLESYASPMPDAFSGNTADNWNNTPDANGVYLHWTLPHALRSGVQKNIAGVSEYPLVPNRWLIIRYHGPLNARTANAWVVESDFLDPNNGTSPYIDPKSTNQLAVTMIGRKVDITNWKETGTADLFLTAVGTGDITFSAYQPYVENVFSIHDPLKDVSNQDVLSYMVAGWYSDSSKDILASVEDQKTFLGLLSELNWEVDESIIQPCNQSLYQGLCYGIQWDKTGPVPASQRPSDATLAVGNTSIDALTALIAKQAEGKADIDVNLLEAFQYNLLPLLDQPNGQDLLYQAIHKAWFGTYKSGYEWVIVKTPSNPKGTGNEVPYPNSPIDWNDPNLDPEWLSQLNRDQADYDDAWLLAQSLQWKLYKMWWTKGAFDNAGPTNQGYLTGFDPEFTDTNFENELDVNQTDSSAWKTQKQNKDAADKLLKIPHGNTQDELQKSIENYATAHNLAKGYELKCYSAGSFYKANDPVVLIAGSKASEPLVDEDKLVCRFASQLITGLTFQTKSINVASMQGKIPVINFNQVTAVPVSLLNEFFFLDPSNATLAATVALGDSSPGTISALTSQMTAHTGYTGTLPALTLVMWEQPWFPMFLLWTVMYYPIAYEENGTQNWIFNGDEYILSDKNMPESDPQDFIISGTTLLTPQSSFNFKKRLDEFRQNHPDLDDQELKALEDFITHTDDWDFLSQGLDGFMQQLICRNNEGNVIPGAKNSTGILIGSNNTNVPILGGVPVPFKGWPTSNFQSFRSGQFCFEKLTLVDRFGQSLQLSSTKTYLQLEPVIAPDMTPEHTVLSQEPYRFMQMSPRILQPARLNFDFVSSKDDAKIINLHSGINPVCAWILPNHIDQALACYDPSGIYLGELSVITNDQAQKIVHWDNAPLSVYKNLDEVAAAFPHLGEMLRALIKTGPDAFVNFYQVIDETLWVVDPLGSRDDQNLSVLVGRPLALTRSRLKYELDGPSVTDPSWQYTFKEDTSAFSQYVFPVKLGELKLRNDGLIGYFNGSDYDQFNCVHMPEIPSPSPYIKPISEGNFIDLTFDDSSKAYITMLIDPRASIHATTTILPVFILGLPSRFVEPALDAMEVTFSVGPLLSNTVIVAGKDNTGDPEVTVLMPGPSEKNGVWSWMEQAGGDLNWNSYPIMQTDDSANLSNINSVLRTGLLKLSSSIKK